MHQPRTGHAVIALADDRLVVSGGNTSAAPDAGRVASVEILDAQRSAWTEVIARPRTSGASALLVDGRIVLAGGGPPSEAELFDPATLVFMDVPGFDVNRWGDQAVALDTRRVLFAGGSLEQTAWVPSTTAVVFDVGAPDGGAPDAPDASPTQGTTKDDMSGCGCRASATATGIGSNTSRLGFACLALVALSRMGSTRARHRRRPTRY